MERNRGFKRRGIELIIERQFHPKPGNKPTWILEKIDKFGWRLLMPGGAFLSRGDYPHHIGRNTWQGRGGPPAHAGHVGLFHTAFLYPHRAALAAALQRVMDAGVTIDGSADHGVSEAIYFTDPDSNGIEIYRDRDPADWPRDTSGGLAMVNSPLDIAALLAEQPAKT